MSNRPNNVSPVLLAQPHEDWEHLPALDGKRREPATLTSASITVHPAFAVAHAKRKARQRSRTEQR